MEKKTIKDYPNYQITLDGRVWSKKRNIYLKPLNNGNGYLCVCLCNNGERKRTYIHRLVAEAFISNTKNKPQVNHINGIKSHNMVNNLEWCNRSENQKHAYNTGLQKPIKGSNIGTSKLTEKQVSEIKMGLEKGYKHKDLARLYDVNRTIITRINNGLIWKHVKT